MRRLGFAPLDTVLGAGTGYRLVLQPSAPMLARLVIHPGFAGSGPSVQTPTVTLSRRDLERLPQPDEDLFRALARLPGVAAGEVSARLRVRGGAADELLYQFDGAELPDPFHLPDLDAALSMIDLRLVGGVDLHAGTLPLELGQRSAGALVFPLPAFDGTPSTTSASLSLTGVRVAQHLRLGACTDADMIVRRGYLDLVLDALGESDGLTPRYGDAYARVRWYGARGRMSAHLLRGDDYLRYAQDDDLQSTARYRTAVGWLTTERERGALGSQHILRIGGEWRPAESRFDLLRLRDTLTVVRGALQRRTDTTRLLDALETHRSVGWVGGWVCGAHYRTASPRRLARASMQRAGPVRRCSRRARPGCCHCAARPPCGSASASRRRQRSPRSGPSPTVIPPRTGPHRRCSAPLVWGAPVRSCAGALMCTGVAYGVNVRTG